MAAVASCDKIKSRTIRRIQCRPNRRFARHRNRGRRETVTRVSIVTIVGQQIAAAQISVESGTEPVNYRWIGLQPHASFQPVDEYRCDKIPFVIAAGFFSTIEANISAS